MRRPLKKLSTISLLLCFIYSQSTFALYKFNAPLFDNLGTFHSPITTTIRSAQKFFDQGMTLFYGFEWGEFEEYRKAQLRLGKKDPLYCESCNRYYEVHRIIYTNHRIIKIKDLKLINDSG